MRLCKEYITPLLTHGFYSSITAAIPVMYFIRFFHTDAKVSADYDVSEGRKRLTFYNVTKNDLMNVQCNASNTHGFVHAGASLNVLCKWHTVTFSRRVSCALALVWRWTAGSDFLKDTGPSVNLFCGDMPSFDKADCTLEINVKLVSTKFKRNLSNIFSFPYALDIATFAKMLLNSNQMLK